MRRTINHKKPPPTATNTAQHFTPRATLVGLGLKIQSLGLWRTIGEQLKIQQKTVKDTPLQKLKDAFIAILAGAHGMCEVNTRVRPDMALQRAFGRRRCAEQSVVQDSKVSVTHNLFRAKFRYPHFASAAPPHRPH